jgi:3-keto-disaccharide hydrolase
MNAIKLSLLCKTSTLAACGLVLVLANGCASTKPAPCPAPWPAARLLPPNQPDPNWLDHDRSRPQPPAVTPATPGTPEQAGKAPSDAVVLFDGKDLSQWSSMDGSPTKWITRDGYMECVKGSGYVRTLQNFGDCQLHVEWATPVPAHGEGQGRGNSGVFLALDRYEVQVLDSYEAKTYADGSAGAVYGQYPPLVNVCRPPGEWQTYDIIYTAPRFDSDRKLVSAAYFTVFQNGVLIQNNVRLTGPTSWLERAPYQPHPEKQPISLQDHGNPVRFRNVWVRELGKPGKNEFTLPDALLDSYIGSYGTVQITREGSQLVAQVGGTRFVLFAESPTKFFAKTTDVQIEFPGGGQGKPDRLLWSVGEGANEAKRSK